MFSRKDQLIRKTGPDGVGRYEFLKQLINEFTTTRYFEAKRQTLANLANFAYDPINYEFIKQLHLIDLFLAQLSENSDELINFALAGLCNLSCDPESREYIITLNGIHLISQQLLNNNEEIVLNALTTLYYLFESEAVVLQPELATKISTLKSSCNPRFSNLSTLFLQKYKTNNAA